MEDWVVIVLFSVLFSIPKIYSIVKTAKQIKEEKSRKQSETYQRREVDQDDECDDRYWEILYNFEDLLKKNTEEVMSMKDAEYSAIMAKVRSVLDERIEKPSESAVSLYYHFQSLQEYVYKWRNDRIDAVEMCREICNINFDLLKDEAFNREMFKEMRSSSMTRLCVIEERMGNYERVLEICDWCYDRFIRDSSGDYFEKRAEKMIEKIAMKKRREQTQTY